MKRQISKIFIVAFCGPSLTSAGDAIQFIEGYDERQSANDFVRYEINVEYGNGDRINASFKDKLTAIEFLSQFR